MPLNAIPLVNRKMFTDDYYPSGNFLGLSPFHLIFIPEFPDFLVEWFASRKFNNFRIIWYFPLEISVPFVPRFFLVEWKTPSVSSQMNTSRHVRNQSIVWKKMATSTFTYNALRTKTLKERIKAQRKIVSRSYSTRAMLLV